MDPPEILTHRDTLEELEGNLADAYRLVALDDPDPTNTSPDDSLSGITQRRLRSRRRHSNLRNADVEAGMRGEACKGSGGHPQVCGDIIQTEVGRRCS